MAEEEGGGTKWLSFFRFSSFSQARQFKTSFDDDDDDEITKIESSLKIRMIVRALMAMMIFILVFIFLFLFVFRYLIVICDSSFRLQLLSRRWVANMEKRSVISKHCFNP